MAERGSAFTHQISPEPAAVLGLFFVLLTILCFLLLSRVKNKHPPRVKMMYIGLLTAIILRTTFFIAAVLAGALFEEGAVAEEIFYLLWAMPHFIFFLIFSSVVYFVVDIFTISHEFFFFSNTKNRNIYFTVELVLVALFAATQIILFFIPADRDVDAWIKASLYGFGIMQLVMILLSLIFLIALKVFMSAQGRTWLKTRSKFRQLYVTVCFWWFGMALRGFSTVVSTAFSWELLFSPKTDWLYWLLLGIVYLISEWFPLLLLLDNTLLMIITTYTMAFALEQQAEEDKERDHLLAGIEKRMTRVIKRSNLYISRAEKLGEGAFGVVYKGKYDGKPVAVKIIKNADVEVAFIEEFGKEVEALASVSHPNIVKFIGACLELPHIAIITEYVHPGSLRKILDNELIDISEDNILKMAIDICKAMIYLHEKGFVHRDLKTDNLLVDVNWNLKVTDFGLARFISERQQSNNSLRTNNIGTVAWAAPEALQKGLRDYTYKVDTYSFGIVIWEIITRKEPYRGIENVKQYVMNGGRPQIPIYMPKFYTRLLKMCWTTNPNLRPDFKVLLKELETYKRGRRDPFESKNFPEFDAQEQPSVSKLISNNNKNPVHDETIVDLDEDGIKERYWSL